MILTRARYVLHPLLLIMPQWSSPWPWQASVFLYIFPSNSLPALIGNSKSSLGYPWFLGTQTFSKYLSCSKIWCICIFWRSIRNNEWQKSGGVPELSMQQLLIDGGQWDACWHQLPLNSKCYFFPVFAIILSWPDKCSVTNTDLSTVQPPYFLETGHLDVLSLEFLV